MRAERTILFAAMLAASTAASPSPSEPTELSGAIISWHAATTKSTPTIGLVADSQFQSRYATRSATWFKGARQDKHIPVTLRPPALDWGARYLLKAYLDDLAAQGASVIFYLGDGANNGCRDEMLEGYGDGTPLAANRGGILRVLDDFRRAHAIPVYYVLGNHDFLGAGNTSKMTDRVRLCADNVTLHANLPLKKLDVIRAVDAFNRQNGAIRPTLGGGYASNFGENPEAVRAACEGENGKADNNQPRHAGCFLAATLDYDLGGRHMQFLLLDTNDYHDVTRSTYFWLQFEGMRGAMSFEDRKSSQTAWFASHASRDSAIRVALTHYPVGALRKLAGSHALSAKSQRFLDLFVDPETGAPRPGTAFVISAHTHTPIDDALPTTMGVDCDHRHRCRRSYTFRELNIGSTTDFDTGATIARFRAPATPDGHFVMEARQLPFSTDCAAIHAALAKGAWHGIGWPMLGVDDGKPHNYWKFHSGDRRQIYQTLDETAGGDPAAARCIAIHASKIEGRQDQGGQHPIPPDE